MNQPITQMMTLLCEVVHTLLVGTNLALLHLLWMMVSGCLLVSRGAVIPGLHHSGLSYAAVRRGWQALRRGGWTIGELIANWEAAVLRAGRWQPRYHAGYCAVPIDLTGFWRPRLQNCPTRHYDHRVGKALPAIVLGLIGRVGQIGSQRLLLPLGILRTNPEHPSETGLMTALIAQFKEQMQPQDVLVTDGGFALAEILSQRIPFVAKPARNVAVRRAQPLPYVGKGRPPPARAGGAPTGACLQGARAARHTARPQRELGGKRRDHPCRHLGQLGAQRRSSRCPHLLRPRLP